MGEIDFSVTPEDAFGVVRCPDCAGVVKEDSPGAAFKYLDIWDCECEEKGV